MSTVKSWINSFRLRTLPLALAGILLGSMLSTVYEPINWGILLLSVVTAVLLQILSNLANDYGDYTKGTDNENRIGPQRALQSGEITRQQMKKALLVLVGLTILSGIGLLWLSFGKHKIMYALFFFGFGLLSIWAALQYTIGKLAYGYKGWGDVFVFVFFGWLSVVGVFFLQIQYIELAIFLPASALGLFSAGVLNLNNTRDIVNDRDSGKITLAVKLGFNKARKYQLLLFLFGVVLSSLYVSVFGVGSYKQLYWISIAPLAFVVIKTYHTTNPKDLDELLKVQALGTLLYAITFGLGQIL